MSTKPRSELYPEATKLVERVNAGLENVGDGSATDLTVVVLRALSSWSLDIGEGAWFYHKDFAMIADQLTGQEEGAQSPVDTE